MTNDVWEAGLISVENFNEAVNYLADRSARLEDGWQLENHNSLSDTRGVKILKKSSAQMIKLKHNIPSTSIIYSLEEDVSEGLCDSEDQVFMTQSPAAAVEDDFVDVVCRTEHHVLYSFSYSVPTIFFNIYKPDGSLVSLEDLWFNIKSNTNIGQNLWSVITQQEHPVLHRPFYHLHPCHTAELLKALQASSIIRSKSCTDNRPSAAISSTVHESSQPSLDKEMSHVSQNTHSDNVCPRSYMLAWLSTVAPLALLTLSHHYAVDRL